MWLAAGEALLAVTGAAGPNAHGARADGADGTNAVKSRAATKGSALGVPASMAVTCLRLSSSSCVSSEIDTGSVLSFEQ